MNDGRGRLPVVLSTFRHQPVNRSIPLETKNAKEFYDQRYAAGYMGQWPKPKLERIVRLIRDLDLPSSGTALDFGCGNGVFTDVIHRALPSWRVVGTDISTVAIEGARRRFK